MRGYSKQNQNSHCLNTIKESPYTVKHLAILVIFLLLPSLPGLAVPAAADSAIPGELTARRPQALPPGLVVPVESVIADQRADRTMLLIDVRPRAKVEKNAIPGAIHIPLHFIRTKAFLKTRPFVLVNEGFGFHTLADECGRLKAAGFRPAILEGGLNLWRRKGGPLAGDPFALANLDAIAPRDFFQEKDMANTLVLDISGERSAESAGLAPRAVHAPLSGPAEKVVSDFGKAVATHAETTRPTVLIFDQTGLGYDNIRRALAKTEMNLFFLEGGLTAYKRYLSDRVAAMKPRESRVKSAGGCTTCAKSE